MEETPFPQYKKGIPKMGLDEVTHFLMAITIAGLPFFFVQMMLGDWQLAPIVAALAAYLTFRWVAIPAVRYVFGQLPPLYIEHSIQTIYFRGGLAARPDPEPVPLEIK